MKVMERKDVYRLIDGERDYQDSRWNTETTISHNIHTPGEWFMYIEDYINEAKHILSREARQDANSKAMSIMRKVAAMTVCAMEYNETPERV